MTEDEKRALGLLSQDWPRVSVTMSLPAMTKLVQFLAEHEEDIAIGLEDFADLRQSFEEMFGRAAAE